MSVKAIVNSVVVAESDKTETVEGNHYFPRQAVREDFLKKSPTQYTCSWKGECTYYNIEVDGQTVEDGAWSYVTPPQAAKNIAGFVAFAPQVEIDATS